MGKERVAIGRYCLKLNQDSLQVGVDNHSGPKIVELPFTKMKAETILESRIIFNLLLADYLERSEEEGIRVPQDVLNILRNEVKILSFSFGGWTESSVNFSIEEIRVIIVSYEKGMRRRIIPMKDILKGLKISRDSNLEEFFTLDRFVTRGAMK